jgi:hypothetical protein
MQPICPSIIIISAGTEVACRSSSTGVKTSLRSGRAHRRRCPALGQSASRQAAARSSSVG